MCDMGPQLDVERVPCQMDGRARGVCTHRAERSAPEVGMEVARP